MSSDIVRREAASSGRFSASRRIVKVAAANDNAPTHALWRKVVAAAIGVVFAFALVLVGLVCTGHAAELSGHSAQTSEPS